MWGARIWQPVLWVWSYILSGCWKESSGSCWLCSLSLESLCLSGFRCSQEVLMSRTGLDTRLLCSIAAPFICYFDSSRDFYYCHLWFLPLNLLGSAAGVQRISAPFCGALLTPFVFIFYCHILFWVFWVSVSVKWYVCLWMRVVRFQKCVLTVCFGMRCAFLLITWWHVPLPVTGSVAVVTVPYSV